MFPIFETSYNPLIDTIYLVRKRRSLKFVAMKYPTGNFPILELYNPSHDIPELHKIRRSADFEVLQLVKDWSGND